MGNNWTQGPYSMYTEKLANRVPAYIVTKLFYFHEQLQNQKERLISRYGRGPANWLTLKFNLACPPAYFTKS